MTDYEKRELIAGARATFAATSMSEAFALIDRLADALKGTLTEPESEAYESR